MKIEPLHEWNLSPGEAVELQKQFAYEVIREDRFDRPIETVAGIDLGYDQKTNTSRAAAVVLSFSDLEVIETSTASVPTPLPYIPGLLSFRETPVAIKTLETLNATPDVIFVDGQGIAHPRRFGIACHIGLITGVPSVGVGKSILAGKFDDLGEEKGSTAPLIHRNEIVGMAVRTKDRVQPVFVSVGHKVGLETAVDLVLRAGAGYRIPEPTRQADKLASFRKPTTRSKSGSAGRSARLLDVDDDAAPFALHEAYDAEAASRHVPGENRKPDVDRLERAERTD